MVVIVEEFAGEDYVINIHVDKNKSYSCRQFFAELVELTEVGGCELIVEQIHFANGQLHFVVYCYPICRHQYLDSKTKNKRFGKSY